MNMGAFISTRENKRSLVFVFSLYTFFAKFHAALRPQLSCCEVSSCDLSSNLGAQGLRSWGSHFWIISRDGPISFPNFYSLPGATWEFYGVSRWCVRSQFSNVPKNRLPRKGILRHTTNLIFSFSKTTDPLALSFFDFLLGASSASTCQNLHFWLYVHPGSFL